MSKQKKWDEIKDDMEDQDDGSQIWKPDNADEWIAGEYFDIDQEIGVKGDSTMYHIRDDNNMHWKVWSTTVLESKMKKVDVGRTVKIVYKGKHQGKSGNFYKVFNVFVLEEDDEDGGEPSSSSIEPERKVKVAGKLRYEANGYLDDARHNLIGQGDMEPGKRELERELDRMFKDKVLVSDKFKAKELLSAAKQILGEALADYEQYIDE